MDLGKNTGAYTQQDCITVKFLGFLDKQFKHNEQNPSLYISNFHRGRLVILFGLAFFLHRYENKKSNKIGFTSFGALKNFLCILQESSRF